MKTTRNHRVVFVLNVLFYLLLTTSNYAQTTIYSEDFSGQDGKGAYGSNIDTSGINSWYIDVSNCNLQDNDDYFKVSSGEFAARDIDHEGIWYSQNINISGYSNVSISVDILPNYGIMEPSDYIEAYYKLDGGAEVLLTNGAHNDDICCTTTATASGLTGSSLQVVVRIKNDQIYEIYYFDNVRVTGDAASSNKRYAIVDGGDWNDGSTWSYSSGGASCNCVPDANSETYIENAYTVKMNDDGITKDLHVAGELVWDDNNVDLTIYDGDLEIENGGSIDDNNKSNTTIVFSGTTMNLVVNDNTNGINIDNIDLEGGSYKLYEEFEGSSFPPNGWVKYNPDGGSGWTSIDAGTTPIPGWNGGSATATPDGQGGSKMAFVNYNTGGYSYNDQYLVTPQVQNIAVGDSLTFWMRKYSGNYYDRVDLLVSTSDNQLSSFTTMLDSIILNAADSGWRRYAYSLDQFDGDDIYIAFNEWVCDNYYAGDAIFLDNVQIGYGSSAVLNVSGNGKILVNDNFSVNSQYTINNDLTSSFTISDNLDINHDDVTFNNNEDISIGLDFFLTSTNGFTLYNYADINIGDDIEGPNTSNAEIHNYGSIFISDDLKGSVAGGEASKLYNYADADLYLGQEKEEDLNWKIFASYDGNTVTYHRDNADFQAIFTPEDAYYNLTFSGGSIKYTSGDLDINGDLRITEDAQVDVENYVNSHLPGNHDIELAGNWINTSISADPFIQGNQKVTFNGDTTQLISSLNNETFYNLEINNTGGYIVLDTNANTHVIIESNGLLTLTDGIILTKDNARVIFQDNAGSGEGSRDSHIDGPVSKVGNDAFTFPLGDEGFYAPLDITAPSNETDSLLAQYINLTPPVVNSLDTGIHHISNVEYWRIEEVPDSMDVNITLNWTEGNNSGIYDVNDLSFVYFDQNDSVWKQISAVPAGTNENGEITSLSFPLIQAGFNYMTLGSLTNSNPLPIELIDFTARSDGKVVHLNWATASEVNNDFFTIEKSTNGYIWEIVTFVDGAGNSNTVLDYSTTDENPYTDVSYYRLKQTDFDGQYEYSDIVAVNHTIDAGFDLMKVYSQENGQVVVEITAASNIPVQLNIYNLNGQLINTKDVVTAFEGINTFNIQAENYAAGNIYVVDIVTENQRLAEKIWLR